MRKLIWRSSAFAFVPVLAGVAAKPIWGGQGCWSLAAGGAFAALAFGSFLEIAQSSASFKNLKGILPVVLPALALVTIGLMGAVAMELLTRQMLRPETFVTGLIAGTLFSQFALITLTERLSTVKD